MADRSTEEAPSAMALPPGGLRELFRRALRDAGGGRTGERWGYILIAPAILLFLVFQLWPLLRGLLMAFSDYRALDPSTHGVFNLNGLSNYREILSDKAFFASFGVTLRYTALYAPLLVSLSLAVAVLIAGVRRPFLAGIYRVVAYIPVVLPVSVSMMLWRQLYNNEFGYLNEALRFIGVRQPPLWMALPELAYWAVLLPDLWLGFGYYTFLFLIGLYNIDSTLYEAASIDGAGAFTRFRRITLPLLKPIFILVLVSQAGLAGGTLPAMTLFPDTAPGGPGQSMMTLGLYAIRTAFGMGDLRMGYGASMGLVTALVSMALSVIIFRLLRTERE